MISGVTSADVEDPKLSSSFSSVIVDIIQDKLKTITILTIQKTNNPTIFLLTYSITTISLTVNEMINAIEQEALSTSSSSLFTTVFTKEGFPNVKLSAITLISTNTNSNVDNLVNTSQSNEKSSTTKSNLPLSIEIWAIIGAVVFAVFIGFLAFYKRVAIMECFGIKDNEEEKDYYDTSNVECCFNYQRKICMRKQNPSNIIEGDADVDLLQEKGTGSARNELYNIYPQTAGRVTVSMKQHRNGLT